MSELMVYDDSTCRTVSDEWNRNADVYGHSGEIDDVALNVWRSIVAGSGLIIDRGLECNSFGGWLEIILFCGERCATLFFFFFSSRRRHTRSDRDWSSDVCSSDLSYVPGRSWQALAHTLISLLPKLTVADLGAGEGTLSQLLAKTARKVIAIDNSPKIDRKSVV